MPLILDISGFEALFEVNYQRLCSTSYRIVRDRDIAENLVQDVFVNLWKNRLQLSISTSLKAYLFQCTISESISYIRKYRGALSKTNIYAGKTINNDGIEEIAVKDHGLAVDEVIDALPESTRLVFILSRYEHLNHKTIARHLDLSLEEVSADMVSALKLLRNLLLLFVMCLQFF